MRKMAKCALKEVDFQCQSSNKGLRQVEWVRASTIPSLYCLDMSFRAEGNKMTWEAA